jgi:AmiR/NasT family two-component response regulator
VNEGAIEVGTLDEAAAAIARLLAVTEATYERRAQLQHALQSRIAIEQAKGILAERHGLDVEQAFEAIRSASRANRLKVHELVRRITPGAETPEEIVRLINAKS